MIPPWMLRVGRTLGASQARVWWALCTHATEPTVIPLATLAAESGTERRTVMAALAELEAAGHIHRTANPGFPSMVCIVNQAIPKLGPVVQEYTGTSVVEVHGSIVPVVNHDRGTREDSQHYPHPPVRIHSTTLARDLYAPYVQEQAVQEHQQAAPAPSHAPAHGSRAREIQNQDQNQDQDQEQTNPKTVPQAAQCVEVLWHTGPSLAPSISPATQDILPGVNDAVTGLHALWQHVTGKRWGLTKDRRKDWQAVIAAAGTIERAEHAVRGLGLSDFHMGRSDKGTRLWIEPGYVLRNLDAFADAGQDAAGGALTAPDPTRGRTWEQITNELLERFACARGDLMDAAHNAWVAGTLIPMRPAELAAFSPKLLPVGKFAFRGYTTIIFPDGPTGHLYLAFIHTCNTTAAMIAADEMRNAYPVSLGMRLLTEQFVSASKKERLFQYARAVRETPNVPVFQQKYVEVEQDSPYGNVEVVS